MKQSSLILEAKAKSSSTLKRHKAGPGTRWVFSDNENNPGGNIYTIVRIVEGVDRPEKYLENHRHDVESMMIFKGANPDLTGLEVEVLLDGNWHTVQSPVAVWVPPGMEHNYRLIKGSGEYWNIVLAPGADYNRVTR